MSNLPTVAGGPPGPDQAGADWQQIMKNAIREPDELCRVLSLPPEYAQRAKAAAGQFPLFVPHTLAARMRPGDPLDPILRQVLPLEAELQSPAGYTTDPVSDSAATLAPGLLKKYAGRALLVVTGACPVHCRYCFRRHFPYGAAPHSLDAWQPAWEQVASDESIRELILSGGDPLVLVDRWLSELVAHFAAIPHLRRLRIHTRMPIMIPQRVTEELIGWLRGTRLVTTVVVHANHAAELDTAVGTALSRLVGAGIPVLNQSVLLAGVNDDVDVLADLCERLLELRVMPYYLHQLDRVSGAAHFEVSEQTGRELIRALRNRLPGFAVPRFVCETPGEAAKTILA